MKERSGAGEEKWIRTEKRWTEKYRDLARKDERRRKKKGNEMFQEWRKGE